MNLDEKALLSIHQEIEILNDNLQTIRLLTEGAPIIKTRLKHVDIYQYVLREQVQNKQLKFHMKILIAWSLLG